MSKSSRVRDTATALGVTLVTLLVLEIGLRVSQKISFGIPITDFLPHHQEGQYPLSPFLTFGPRLDYQIEDREYPELAYFDSNGFRTNEPVGEKPDGEFRIIALGGSTTENVWNEAGLHWPLVVECELRAAGRPQVRVLNSAMSAYTTAHSLVRLQFDVLDYEPDMVLVMHGVNDLHVVYAAAARGITADGHYASQYSRPAYTGAVSEDDVVLSRLWRAIGSRVLARPEADRSIPYDLDPGIQYFSRNLGSMTNLIGARSGVPVLLTMPFDTSRVHEHGGSNQGVGLLHLPDAESFDRDMTAYNDRIRAAADSASGVMVVDMAALLTGTTDYFVDAVHYSTEGVVAFGTQLAAELLPSVPAPTGEIVLTQAAERRCAWQ